MKYTIPTIFLIVAAVILWLIFGPSPFGKPRDTATVQTKIISPQTNGALLGESAVNAAERMAYEDEAVSKVALAEGEVAVTVITQDLDGDPQDEQLIAYRKTGESDGPIYISYIDFDDSSGSYKRVWSAPSAATKPRTFSMYVKDLIGDRSLCLIATGINGSGEQTLTIFRKKAGLASLTDEPFKKIAELRTDGSISVQEADRSQAYQLGLAAGGSYKIASYGRDFESSNILDQIETTYAFDATTGRYERVGTARIPGTQIEQRRVRELLDGTPEKFERFLDGLWYFIPAGSAANETQHILFDIQRREIVFYVGDIQEVFSWQNSSATRYGLYLSTQNISVTTLRRLVDIELESVDTIRVKVFEDVKLKIGIGGHWDGTYRKLGIDQSNTKKKTAPIQGADASYEGASGRLQFFSNGHYELSSNEKRQTGSYVFFMLGDKELLEMRTEDLPSSRFTYQVERKKQGKLAEELRLHKVRLGVGGIENLHEEILNFTRVQ
ncbi:hypothetical protein MASR2M78_03990 [Treponema sp.]